MNYGIRNQKSELRNLGTDPLPQSFEPKELIYWDVDTAKDFMDSGGALYVPGAESLKPNLAKLTRNARSKGIPVFAQADAHDLNSAELQRNGGPFPDHGMKGTDGYQRIPETALEDALVIPNLLVDSIDSIVQGQSRILMEKDSYDIATNPNFERTIAALSPKKAIMYGVATEYCVLAACKAGLAHNIEIYLVKDAIAGITEDGARQALEEMVLAGAKLITTEEAIAGDFLRDSVPIDQNSEGRDQSIKLDSPPC